MSTTTSSNPPDPRHGLGRFSRRLAMVAITAGLFAGVLGACDAGPAYQDLPSPMSTALKTGPTGTPLASVVAIEILDPLTGASAQLPEVDSKNAHTYSLPEGSGERWGWPNPNDDLGTDQATVIWQLHGDEQHSLQQLQQLVMSKAYTLSLNGKKLARGDAKGPGVHYITTLGAAQCPEGGACFTTTIYREGWPGQNVWGPNFKTLELLFDGWENEFPVVVYVVPALYPASYFSTYMDPTFRHIRCSGCHGLGDEAHLINFHTSGGLTAQMISSEPSAVMSGDRLTCNNGCHTAEITGPIAGRTFDDDAWFAPAFNMGLDWFAMSAEQICNKVTTLTAEQLDHHFHEDARQAWAVHSGMIPFREMPEELAPPNDYDAWLDIVEPWLDAGTPCAPPPPPPSQIAAMDACSAQYTPYSPDWWWFCMGECCP